MFEVAGEIFIPVLKPEVEDVFVDDQHTHSHDEEEETKGYGHTKGKRKRRVLFVATSTYTDP